MQATTIHILREKAPHRREAAPVISGKPKLLDHFREAFRSRHYSRRTEQTYTQWINRFIFFHNVRDPAEMAEAEINAFLTHLAVKEKVSASSYPSILSLCLAQFDKKWHNIDVINNSLCLPIYTDYIIIVRRERASLKSKMSNNNL